MTPTEKGRRYDALYYGHRTTQELCEMVVAREQDVEDLQERCRRLEDLVTDLGKRIRAMKLTADMLSIDARVIEGMRELGLPYE